jgi:glycerol-3-phosphate dehydrogenase (NAD(P)+)
MRPARTWTFETMGVIGGGAWGTALAQTCVRPQRKVLIWARESEVVQSINSQQQNRLFLPGIDLSPDIEASGDLAALSACDLVLAVPPAQHLRATLAQFAAIARPGCVLVLCAKGIEQGSLKLMTQVATEVAPGHPLAVLSGPSFAAEVAKGLPTAITLACGDRDLGRALADHLASPSFRPYLSHDLIGAEAGGAVKNVLAIACGVVEGRKLGRSAHAAVLTRGFAEMTRLAVALGAEAETLAGLCGLGDLVLTCSSPQSRNMSVGLALGRGDSLAQALSGKLSVAEGVASAPAVRALAARLGVETPICEAVAGVLAGEMALDTAIAALLSRPLRAEIDPQSP